MKISAWLVLVFFLQLPAECYSQEITLKLENVTVQKAFRAIEKQSGYSFVYGKEQVSDMGRVSVTVSNAGINETLSALFREKPFAWSIVGKYISIRKTNSAIDLTETKIPTLR